MGSPYPEVPGVTQPEVLLEAGLPWTPSPQGPLCCVNRTKTSRAGSPPSCSKLYSVRQSRVTQPLEPHNREKWCYFSSSPQKTEALRGHPEPHKRLNLQVPTWSHSPFSRPGPQTPKARRRARCGASVPGAPSGSLLPRPALSGCSVSPGGHQDRPFPAPLTRLWLLRGGPAGPYPSLIQPESPEGLD